MTDYELTRTGFDISAAASDGNRFLLANGYMGLRGTPEEAGADMFPAVTLAGVYDRYRDKWREPVNAPRGLYLRLAFNGKSMALGEAEALSHSVSVDYAHGVYRRNTDFGPVRVETERFVSMARPHLMADRIRLSFAQSGDAVITAGISADIWDINGPHLFDFSFGTGEALSVKAVTGEKKITVAVSQACGTDSGVDEGTERHEDGVFRMLRRRVRPGEKITVDLFAAVFTSLDGQDPGKAAAEECLRAKKAGFERCLDAHAAAWDGINARSAMDLEGDETAALALRASQYHLNSIAPRHASAMSIPARGLSGQTYKGAIFWDTEMFMLPMFAHTQPEAAASLLRYRIATLPGALKKAAEYGYRGAFYAWESQEGGSEGCTDFNVVDVFTHRPVRTYFRDKQIHISGDVVYALRRYTDITGDRSLIENGGAEVILQCARFYLSRAVRRLDRDEVSLEDVIGPDEYHERVSNNAYTNRIVRHCFESALWLEDFFASDPERFKVLMAELDYADDWTRLGDALSRLRSPRRRGNVIEQFDGYFDLEDCTLDTVRSRLVNEREYWGGDHGVAGPTQIIKQADVIAMMALFPEDYTDEEVRANWEYYEKRTEHGSSLSACMYALTACRVGLQDRAWDLFLRTASIDITGGGKQWAGEIYIGGTHPASNGGAWMIAALGFAGLSVRGEHIGLRPRLPAQISRLRFPVTAGGRRLTVTVTHEGAFIS